MLFDLEIPGILRIAVPKGQPVPVVLDVPHSGRDYPKDLGSRCSSDILRTTEDAYVDELVRDATEHGITVITALFPRCCIDVNRAEDDIDPAVINGTWPQPLKPSERTLHGLGLVRRMCKPGVAMYDKPLPVADVERRVRQFYQPYHTALDRTLRMMQKRFGTVWHLNCHSMPSVEPNGDGGRPDIVLSDRDGTSADSTFRDMCVNFWRDMRYRVDINEPYKGAEILRRHGQPHHGFHSIQLEMNRALYLDEQKIELLPKHDTLKKALNLFFERLAMDDQLLSNVRLAAE